MSNAHGTTTGSEPAVVRLGLVGLGNIGRAHAQQLLAGGVTGLRLTAVADADPARLAPYAGVAAFPSAGAMLAAGGIDALLIATPHFDHVPTGIAALQAGRHVLLEKPIAVHVAEGARLIAAHTRRDRVFAAMFNQRTDPAYQKIRALVRGGELGAINRIHWTSTKWLRTDAYYASGGWRATWAGEGGGILLNQCLHHLDLLQWICGMPRQVRAFCGFGRHHHIEVEDEVTAFLEYAGGATAVFTCSSGEAPGTNRLEIAGDRGRLLFEADGLTHTRNSIPASEFMRTSAEPFAVPATTEEVQTFTDHGGQHREILQNFADAIRHGTEIIAPAAEGIHSLTLANAMLLSAWTGETVTLPLDATRYENHLRTKIAASNYRPETR